MQKISSIHPFILAIQQISESYDLKGATQTFDHAHPIIISYPEFVSPFKKSVYLKALKSGWPQPPQYFSINF